MTVETVLDWRNERDKLRDEVKAQADRIAKLEAALEAEPVAWLHTMHYETNETNVRVTLDEDNPWGEPGEDYSAEYEVTTEPLYRKAMS